MIPKPWRWPARLAWLALAGASLGVLAWAASHDLSVQASLVNFGWSREAYLAAQAQLGVAGASLDFYYVIVTNLVRLTYVVVGLALFVRRPNDPMAYFASLTLLTFSITAGGVGGLAPSNPVMAGLVVFLQAFGQSCLLLFIFVFPNGRFAPRWMRWPTLIAVLGLSLLGRIPALRDSVAASLFTWLSLAWILLSALPAQIYRYRRISTPIERQQTKLVVLAFAVFLFGAAGGWLTTSVILPIVLPAAVPAAGTGARLTYDFAQGQLQVLPSLAIPLSLGIAILRYRLWDIDFIIRRTLVYSVLTGLLALAFLGSVLVLQSVFQTLTGQGQDQLVTVISTLGIAAMFVPLRTQVQGFIDRRFFRGKYDAATVVAAFGGRLRDEVELHRLTTQLIETVEFNRPARPRQLVAAAAARLAAPPP